MTEQRSVTFEATLAASGDNTGLEVPPKLVARLGAGRRPPSTSAGTATAAPWR